MIKGLEPALWEKVNKGSIADRKYICSKSFAYFAFYYFSDYFLYKTPPFHWYFFDDCEKILSGELRDVLWIAYRESAKTTIAKMFVVYCICFRKKKYIAWDSYDGTNAESALFDVSLHLQTNKKILQDFGYLYRRKKSQKTKEEQEEDAPEMKRGSVFITTNKVKVECFTTQYSARGRISGKERPDLFVFDDIENNITKESIAITQKIISHVDEVNTGLQNTGSQLFLGNYITEEGSIAHIRQRFEGKRGKIVRDIKIITQDADGNRVPSWPGKYVMTNQEALKKNVGLPREEHVISLEQKREDWGDTMFNTEGMNDPGKSGDYYFDREKVRMAKEKAYECKKEVAGFKTWANFDPTHRYGLGADTAEGFGGDHSTTAIIDFSQKPSAVVVGTYKDNEIAPNTFAHEIVRHARAFGECFVIPEINNTGEATVPELITIGYWNMYVREVKNKTSGKVTKEYGWRTGQNKHDIFSQFKTAFEAGEIEIYDIDLLNEMYHYTKQNLRQSAKVEGMTRHFDLLMAVCLAWEARHHATLSKADKKDMYKSPNAGANSIKKPYVV